MLLVLSSSTFAFQPNEFSQSSYAYVETLIHASTTPVAINEFINDWQGSLKKGDYAYADGRLRTGVVVDGWEVALEKRWHYDLRFTPDTAQLYYNIENKFVEKSEYKLDLNAKILHADGLRLAKLFHYQQFSIKPIVTYYNSSFYQFSHINSQLSAKIIEDNEFKWSSIKGNINIQDYHFDRDKILEDDNTGGAGFGISTDIAIQYNSEKWGVSVISQDLFNYWRFKEAAFYTLCIDNEKQSCGKDHQNTSGHESYKTRLSSSLSTEVTYKPYGLSVNTFTHGRYQRLGVQKDWFTPVGVLGASVYSTKQVGLQWQSQWHRLGLLLDQPNWKKARHAQIDLAITVPW